MIPWHLWQGFKSLWAMTELNYTDSYWLNPENVLHYKKYVKYHILWDEYIKTFILKYVGQSLRLWWDMRFGSWEFNYHWIWTTTTCLDSLSPFSCSLQLSILSPYHRSPCPKPLSSSMLLYPFSFTPSVYTSQIHSRSHSLQSFFSSSFSLLN